MLKWMNVWRESAYSRMDCVWRVLTIAREGTGWLQISWMFGTSFRTGSGPEVYRSVELVTPRAVHLSNGSLYIARAEPDHAGSYVCRAENSVSHLTSTINVAVNCEYHLACLSSPCGCCKALLALLHAFTPVCVKCDTCSSVTSALSR